MWQKIKCFFGFHPSLTEAQSWVDYYHDRFIGRCTVCKKVLYDKVKFGDWG